MPELHNGKVTYSLGFSYAVGYGQRWDMGSGGIWAAVGMKATLKKHNVGREVGAFIISRHENFPWDDFISKEK